MGLRLVVIIGVLFLAACSRLDKVSLDTTKDSHQQMALGFADNPANYEFSPIQGETITIPVQIPEKTQSISMTIYSSDGDLIRTVTKSSGINAGKNLMIWDGKDEIGTVVPDEAYSPVITLQLENGEQQVIDPRSYSGGESVNNVPVEITPDQQIAYQLPAACRVLIRAGIKNGPMLRNLSSWQPRGAGKNIQRWDGRDQNGLIDIRKEQNLGILAIAFKLPEYTILTNGNQQTDYRTYRLAKNWPVKTILPEQAQLNRNGVAISPHYYTPRSYDPVPEVSLTLPEVLSRSASGIPQLKLNTPVAVKTDIAEQDRWMMKQSLYEVAFFVDHEFVAEEEQGYVPLTWQWLPQQIKPGRHLLTVNISGFSGKVGVASLIFEVIP